MNPIGFTDSSGGDKNNLVPIDRNQVRVIMDKIIVLYLDHLHETKQGQLVPFSQIIDDCYQMKWPLWRPLAAMLTVEFYPELVVATFEDADGNMISTRSLDPSCMTSPTQLTATLYYLSVVTNFLELPFELGLSNGAITKGDWIWI